jgi:secreted PhoX family phosphatase
MPLKDQDLEVRADGVGRRGEVGRRAFVRAGVIGAAMGSAALMSADRAAGAATMARRVATAKPRGVGMVQAGPELALPPGFSYHTFGAFGSAMTDGFITPPIHDGMACFDMGNGRWRIVRNHELGEGNDIPAGTVIGDPKTAYDRKAPGGTVTLEIDAKTGHLIADWVSLNGTDTNCAGIKTPWGTWMTCEETVVGPSSGYKKPHGYVFEVDPRNNEAVLTRPYKKLGRMLHEAGAIDPRNGVVYMTEDEGPDGFYRFVPEKQRRYRGEGVLQMLRVRGEKGYNTITGQTVGKVLSCDWVDIDDPNPRDAEENASAVFRQGRAKGGAKFLGGEGCTWRGDGVVFGSSEGGEAGLGQVWQYTPKTHIGKPGEHGELVLLFESQHRGQMDGPDNMCTSPGGAIVIAEDGNVKSNFVRALLANGTTINVAENLVAVQQHYIEASGKLYDPTVPDDGASAGDGVGFSEFAGPCFSPDGKWLFVNIQVPGITCAITGPWASIGL